jgi:hypothetical protein
MPVVRFAPASAGWMKRSPPGRRCYTPYGPPLQPGSGGAKSPTALALWQCGFEGFRRRSARLDLPARAVPATLSMSRADPPNLRGVGRDGAQSTMQAPQTTAHIPALSGVCGVRTRCRRDRGNGKKSVCGGPASAVCCDADRHNNDGGTGWRTRKHTTGANCRPSTP